MRRAVFVVFVVLLTQPVLGADAEDAGQTPFLDFSRASIALESGARYPVESDSTRVLELGAGGGASVSVPFGDSRAVGVRAAGGYTFLPLSLDSSISLIDLSVGPSMRFTLGGRMFVIGNARAGGYFAFLNQSVESTSGKPVKTQSGAGAYAAGTVAMYVRLFSWYSLGLSGGYSAHLGLTHGPQGGLSMRFRLGGT
jgi:hypothetical protein